MGKPPAYELPFLEQQLRTLGEDPSQIRVMDTACGTGHHAIALANLGFQVSGSDLFRKWSAWRMRTPKQQAKK
jgi:2-polyprenyl-3-methyl-5-hydroxy-6-metoxy-1,4-benzoquinol methylase